MSNLEEKMAGQAVLVKVDFHGDELHAIKHDGRIWISIRRVCEALGIDPDGQRVKLKTKAWAVTEFISVTGPDGKSYVTCCVDLDSLPMWLATIEPSRVAEDVRPKLERYQIECARVLRAHFFGPAAPRKEPAADREQRLMERERRLQMVAEQRRREFEHRVLADLAARLERSKLVPPANVEALIVRAAEVATGQDLTALKPLAEGGWTTPTDIAAQLKVSAYRVGRIITALELKGPDGRGLAGMSEPYHNTAAGTHRDVICYRYSPAAVALIRARLAAEEEAPTKVVPLRSSDDVA